VSVPESSLISSSIRDALAAIHQDTLELIVHGASLEAVLDALCDGIDALDPDMISSVFLADTVGQHLWPAAGRRVPEDYKQLVSPLPIAPVMGACGTAAFRKERVISPDIATDPLWSGPAEKYRRTALQHCLHTAWSVPIVSDSGDLLGTFGLPHATSKAVGNDELELLEKVECYGHGAGARTASTSRRPLPVFLTPCGTPSGATSRSPACIGISRPSSRKMPSPSST
jgi:GAF domain-containing protein